MQLVFANASEIETLKRIQLRGNVEYRAITRALSLPLLLSGLNGTCCF